MNSQQWLEDLNTGLQTCPFLLLFVNAEMIGLEPPLYPGEMTDWSTKKPVTQYVHRTVFIFHTIGDVTTMYHYDSFGGVALEDTINPFVGKQFYDNIKHFVNTNLVFNDSLSDRVGIQSVLRGGRKFRDHTSYLDNGYCKLYALFWAYNVLQLRESFVGTPLKDWAKFVERYYLNKYQNRIEDLYDLVLSFGFVAAKQMMLDKLSKSKASTLMSSFTGGVTKSHGVLYPINIKVLDSMPRETTIADIQTLRDMLDAKCHTESASKRRKHSFM